LLQAFERATRAALLVLIVSAAPVLAATLTATDTGWFGSDGRTVAYTGNPHFGNYAVGWDPVDFSEALLLRDFFIFNLAGVSGTITSATLDVPVPSDPPDSGEGYLSYELSEPYQLTSTTTPVSDLTAVYPDNSAQGQTIFGTLGTGTLFASTTVTAADDGQTLQISLNAAALAYLNSNEGNSIALTGQDPSAPSSGPKTSNCATCRFFFTNTDPTGAGVFIQTPEPTLVLGIASTPSVPEPGTFLLLAGPGFLLLLIGARRRDALKFCLPLVLVLTMIPAKATSIISDGGFEEPTPTNPRGMSAYTGSLGDGWTVTSGSVGVYANGNGTGNVSHSGNQFVYLDWGLSSDTLSQTLTTVAGQEYAISYWVADIGPDPLQVTFGGSTLFSGTAPTGGVTSSGDYVEYTFDHAASSTSTVLSFTGQYTGVGNGTLLDDVSVTAVSSVPEPATYALLTGGLTAFGLLRKRVSQRGGCCNLDLIRDTRTTRGSRPAIFRLETRHSEYPSAVS